MFGLSNELQPRDLLDPSFLFTPERDGDYLLEVGDTRGMGGPTFVYRVEVEPVGDSVFTYVVSTANDAFEANRVTGFIVPRGNRWTLNVLLGEGQGNRYKGDLELVAVGLPTGRRDDRAEGLGGVPGWSPSSSWRALRRRRVRR